MSWKIAFVVALLTAIITAIVTAPVADKVTGLHGVSDFEGKRGFAIAFLFIPAGFLGGFLLGLLGTHLTHATEWEHFWKAAGVSIGMAQLALFGIAGLSLLAIPRPLKAIGHALAVEVEVMVPNAMITPGALEPDGIRMSLYAGPKDNRGVLIDRARFHELDGHLIVPALATLHSRSSTRILSFHLEDLWLAYDLPLPDAPIADTTWSEPAPLRDARNGSASSQRSDIRLRYRVVKAPAGDR